MAGMSRPRTFDSVSSERTCSRPRRPASTTPVFRSWCRIRSAASFQLTVSSPSRASVMRTGLTFSTSVDTSKSPVRLSSLGVDFAMSSRAWNDTSATIAPGAGGAAVTAGGAGGGWPGLVAVTVKLTGDRIRLVLPPPRTLWESRRVVLDSLFAVAWASATSPAAPAPGPKRPPTVTPVPSVQFSPDVCVSRIAVVASTRVSNFVPS